MGSAVIGNLGSVVAAGRELRRFHEAANSFEATLFQSMFAAMRRTVPTVQWGQSSGAEMFRDFLDLEVAKSAATRSKGPGDLLFNEFADDVVRQSLLSRNAKQTTDNKGVA
jgi:Rod binding domain-containing protein